MCREGWRTYLLLAGEELLLGLDVRSELDEALVGLVGRLVLIAEVGALEVVVVLLDRFVLLADAGELALDGDLVFLVDGDLVLLPERLLLLAVVLAGDSPEHWPQLVR